MMTKDQIQRNIQILIQAKKNVKQAEQLSVTFPEINIDDAYAISQGVSQFHGDSGRSPCWP